MSMYMGGRAAGSRRSGLGEDEAYMTHLEVTSNQSNSTQDFTLTSPLQRPMYVE